jgi:hypothetical protein
MMERQRGEKKKRWDDKKEAPKGSGAQATSTKEEAQAVNGWQAAQASLSASEPQ